MPLEDKEVCLRTERSCFWNMHVFGDALKSRLSEVVFLAFSPKTTDLAFLPKTKVYFWHFHYLVVPKKEGGIS